MNTPLRIAAAQFPVLDLHDWAELLHTPPQPPVPAWDIGSSQAQWRAAPVIR